MFTKLFSRLQVGKCISSTLGAANLNRVCCAATRQLVHSGVPDGGKVDNKTLLGQTNCTGPTQFDGAKSFGTAELLAVDESPSQLTAEVTSLVSQSVRDQTTGRLFAVVHVCGKQRKITTEDIIIFDKHIEADVGERILLNKVLLVGGRDFTLIGRPLLTSEQVRVEATVIEKTLSHTMVKFWYRRRKNTRRFKLRRIRYTFLRINSIQLTPPS